jgi:hypothetical protein
MKGAAEWALYVVGALAVGYLALYLYAVFRQPNFQPGDPIRIFRKPDAPNYSATGSLFAEPINTGAQASWATAFAAATDHHGMAPAFYSAARPGT